MYLQLFEVTVEQRMPGILLESLEADALVAIVEHAAVGAEFVAVVLIRSCSRYLTRTHRHALSSNRMLYDRINEGLFMKFKLKRNRWAYEIMSVLRGSCLTLGDVVAAPIGFPPTGKHSAIDSFRFFCWTVLLEGAMSFSPPLFSSDAQADGAKLMSGLFAAWSSIV